MNAEICLNRYAPYIFSLKDLNLSPLAMASFGIITNLVKKSGRCFVYRASFAQVMRCHIGSVSRAITELVKADLVKRTGDFHALLFPIIEITARGKKYAPKASFSEPQTAPLQANHEYVTPPSQDCYTEEKKEKINIKEQTTKPVCLSVKIEESKTRLKLQSFGIGKNKAKELCRKFPEERIKRQIENLGQVIEQKKEIKNKAGWLIKAIKDNFYPSRMQESAEEKKRQDAEQLLQRARELEMRGQYQEAKHEALASLRINKSTVAQNLLASLDKLLSRKDAIAMARAAISDKQWEAIRCEELEKQLIITRKLGGPKLDKLAHMNAITAANERLLGVENFQPGGQ